MYVFLVLRNMYFGIKRKATLQGKMTRCKESSRYTERLSHDGDVPEVKVATLYLPVRCFTE